MKKILSVCLILTMLLSSAMLLASCNKTETKKAKMIDIALTDEVYAFGVKKNDTELLTALNDFLKEIKQNGKFDEVINKYFGDGTPTAVVSAAEDSNKDQLIVATNASFEPFEYMVGLDYYGVDLEIMSLFAQKLNKELVINNMNFDSVCTAVGNGQCDVAAAGLTVKEDRKELVDFSDSYFNASQRLIVCEDDQTFDDCKTVADVEAKLKTLAEGTKVGSQNGTTGYAYVAGDEDFGFAGFANLKMVGYANASLAVQDMLNGNISYVVVDEAPAKKIVSSINAMNENK